MRQKPKNDLEFSRLRLDTILGRCQLLFNPYKVSDRQLLDYAWQGNWGKTVFVSRVVRGYRTDGSGAVAYRMYPLRGNLASDAAMIRKVMCEAKIEMLQRVLNNPEPMFYLSCSKGFFDYEPRIQAVIERIKTYPQTPVPPD